MRFLVILSPSEVYFVAHPIRVEDLTEKSTIVQQAGRAAVLRRGILDIEEAKVGSVRLVEGDVDLLELVDLVLRSLAAGVGAEMANPRTKRRWIYPLAILSTVERKNRTAIITAYGWRL